MSPMRTRLFRPPVTDDYVRRESLEQALEEGRKYPIVLVSAPAGYGKSTQLSHWIGRADTPYVWISLEDIHNDLGTFLQYLEVGVRDWSPETAKLLRTMSEAAELPPANRVADAVTNSMAGVEDDLILVLDDYHNIRSEEVHQFVSALLTHMSDSLRVAIGTRRTPPIALGRLRSRNLVLDIRLQDLQFGDGAMLAIVKKRIGVDLDPASLARLKQISEGWPAGLQMLLLALADNDDVPAFLEKFEGNIWQIQEYLVEEVLRQLPPDVARKIGTTAILDRFSAELCQALMASADESDVSGEQLVDLIRSRGLFCIPLDDRGEWFRYHHLFHELLLRQSQSRLNEVEIRALHGRAAKWFDAEGLLTDAIRHYLRSEDSHLAAQMILRHKEQLIRKQEWRRLDQALNLLPTTMIEGNVELLALYAWTSIRMGRIAQLFESVRLAQDLLANGAGSGAIDHGVSGEIAALQAVIEYHHADARAALACADKALELLPSEQIFARGEATLIRGPSLQMLGNAAEGRSHLLEALQQSGRDSGMIRARILYGLCHLNLAEGHLNELKHYATAMLEYDRDQNNDLVTVQATWLAAIAHYQQNNLDAAAEIIRPVIQLKWLPHQRTYLNCVQTMCAIHAARSEHSQALDLSEVLLRQSLESRSTDYVPEIHALQADLALARGDQVTASHWALEWGPGPLTAAYSFSVPALSAARVFLRTKVKDGRKRAKAILDKCQAFFETTNNVRFLIETLTLQAVLHSELGEAESASEMLGRAVTLAEPGGFIRVFVDQGPAIVPLLNRLELNEQQLKYVGEILAGFQHDTGDHAADQSSDKAPQGVAGLLEPLSKRENDVLELLAERLTNKEIGERLFISPDTVKRHAHNIFAKLNVSSRREARAKAIGLGIVSS